MNYSQWLCIIVLCFVVLYMVYLLLWYSFQANIKQSTEEWAKKLQNNKINALLNGSGINNIPNLNIISTNAQVTTANDCQNGPVYIGEQGTRDDCIQTCVNSSANVLNVREGDTYAYDSHILQKGAYCIIGPRPQCNMRTTIALMTINSIICRSKFPNIIGGDLGTEIVACNNRIISDPQNILWDYGKNEKFSPYTTTITDADEKLPDGSYRFACKYNGTDSASNNYIPNPLDRFHPMINYCAGLVRAADSSVQTVFDMNDQTFHCDCGDFEQTRVQNIDPNNKASQCSNLIVEDRVVTKSKRELIVPYKCFNLFSPLSDVGRYLPCPNDLFTRDGAQMATVTIPFTLNPSEVIEHPKYADMNNANVSVTIHEIN